ncbi:helix-turn-helix domain-containing protein [Labrys sp. KB_33_2]|uniref:helix-turn-helix domain-containing protein n=1 Tax=Labrys sp. KB_33_2 TaxID=3237479 RepID=UPI003F920252
MKNQSRPPIKLPAKPASATEAKASLGDCLRDIRLRNQWTLSQMSAMTGLAVSTLSKVENNQMSLTYDRLIQLAEGLGVDIVELFGTRTAETSQAPLARRAISRIGEGRPIKTSNYDYFYLCTDISKKAMVPIMALAHARSMAEFGPFIRHVGEEYTYVLEGELELHTEYYAPVRLKAGESCYFDAAMGHAYISVSEEPARVLCICSISETDLIAATQDARPGPAARKPRAKKTVGDI